MPDTALAFSPPIERELDVRALNAAGRRTYLALFACEHFLGPWRFSRLLGKARERNRARMLAYFADWPKDEVRPAPEVEFTTHEAFYRNHVRVWEPVVFRGTARDWPAVRNWDLKFFADNFPTTKAVIIDQQGLYGEGEAGRYEISTLGNVAASIMAGGKECLRFSPIIDENPQLKDDLDMKWFGGFRSAFALREVPQFFLAPADTFTPLHCALESNVFVQVQGRKRWLMYPAMYDQLLEPPADRRPYFYTGYRPDFASPIARRTPSGSRRTYPLARYAPAWEVVLEPGDVLYIPPFVWHHVENLDDTIAVAYRFFSLRTGFRSSLPLTILKFLATRPSLIHTLYYSLTGTGFLYKPQPAATDPQ